MWCDSLSHICAMHVVVQGICVDWYTVSVPNDSDCIAFTKQAQTPQARAVKYLHACVRGKQHKAGLAVCQRAGCVNRDSTLSRSWQVHLCEV